MCSSFLLKICLIRRNSFALLVTQRQFLANFLNKIHCFLFSLYTSIYFRFHVFVLLSQEKSNEPNDPELLFPNQSENLMHYVLPGLYRFQCLTNKKVYIGESANVLSRVRFHYHILNSRKHDCVEFQNDFNLYGAEKFTCHVLYSGPDWLHREKRKAKETEILNAYTEDQVYNNHPTKTRFLTSSYRVICNINGQIYNSTHEAAKALNMSESELRRKLRNNFPGYTIVEKIEHCSTPVIIDGTEYASLLKVIEAGLAKNRQQVGRRLKSNLAKWAGWKYKYGKKKPEENSDVTHALALLEASEESEKENDHA